MSGIVSFTREPNGYAQFPNVSLAPYKSNASTNFPVTPTGPVSLRDWWRELHGEIRQPEPPGPVHSAVVGLRQNAESAVIGALLAIIDTDLGGLDLGGRIPLDWAGAAVFYALSIQGSGKSESLSLDFRAMGQACTSVAMFRTVHNWRESRKGIPRNIPQMIGDPVLAAGVSKKWSKEQF